MATTGVLTSRRHAQSGARLLRFVGVAWRAQTYRNVVYLLAGLPLGIAYFLVLAVGLATGAALAVVFVGLLILAATLFAWRLMAALERMLARSLLRIPIPAPVDRAPGLPTRRRVELWLRDPVTWKSLVFVVAKLPMGILSFAVVAALGFCVLVLAVAPAIVAFVPVIFFGWEMGTPSEALPAVPAGVLGLLVCLHLFNGVAWLYGACARAMLGPSAAELRDRVEGLRDAGMRIIAAADDERRRIERDLHDGAQQRLVALALTLNVAESRLPTDPDGAARLVVKAREEVHLAVKELRELARGIHPALLGERGLGPALDALAARAPVPVEISGVPERRLPAAVESTAYFMTAEALTNVAKYAQASAASVTLVVDHDRLRLEVRDDGIGGADPEGTGLRGLRDRAEALDGRLGVHSPDGGGTTVVAEIPLERE